MSSVPLPICCVCLARCGCADMRFTYVLVTGFLYVYVIGPIMFNLWIWQVTFWLLFEVAQNGWGTTNDSWNIWETHVLCRGEFWFVCSNHYFLSWWNTCRVPETPTSTMQWGWCTSAYRWGREPYKVTLFKEYFLQFGELLLHRRLRCMFFSQMWGA